MSALAAGALFAVSANAAVATTWNPTPTGGYVTAPSGFTLYKNGGSATSCTITKWTGFFAGAGAAMEGGGSQASCAGKTTFNWQLQASGLQIEGGYQLNPFLSQSSTHASPWGNYQQCYTSCGLSAPIGTWQNGSGATSSSWTFTKQPIGKLGPEVISISGTFNVTTLTGGLLTLK